MPNYNEIESREEIKNILYSKEFYRKIQTGRMFSSVLMLSFLFIAIVLILFSCFYEEDHTVFIGLIASAVVLLIIPFLILALGSWYRTNKIKKFIKKRYTEWQSKYYVLCSDNYEGFKMSETEDSTIFKCEYFSKKFYIKVDEHLLQIQKSENDIIDIVNDDKNILYHTINFNKGKIYSLRNDFYFAANEYAASQLASHIQKDIAYILKMYESH